MLHVFLTTRNTFYLSQYRSLNFLTASKFTILYPRSNNELSKYSNDFDLSRMETRLLRSNFSNIFYIDYKNHNFVIAAQNISYPLSNNRVRQNYFTPGASCKPVVLNFLYCVDPFQKLYILYVFLYQTSRKRTFEKE